MSVRALFQVIALSLSAVFGQAANVSADTVDKATVPASERPLTTYERFLPLAVAGDPAIQHFLGYMFFYGEGVSLNYGEAHYWFHLAAEEGDARAQRNLGIFHSRAISRIPEKYHDPVEANLWFSLAAANPENPESSSLAAQSYEKFLSSETGSRLFLKSEKKDGESLYLGSCAGCHGFNGVAAYPGAPSFASGDRLEKSDQALAKSIHEGKGMMPTWGEILSKELVAEVLFYIRREFDPGPKAQAVEQSPAEDSDQLALGEQVYLEFCGGCHGFNGIAWYVNSPSFALRERMHKSDAELANSIKNGRGAMPSWEYMLKPQQIDALVKFVRTLAQTYENGIIGELRRPRVFLRFRPNSETGPNWTADDIR